MRKRFLALLLAGAVALGLCGCTPVEEDSGKLSVVCSLFPYYDFVRVIGGEWVEPRLLVRRMYVVAGRVLQESEAAERPFCEQLDLFTDYAAQENARLRQEAELKRERSLQEAALLLKRKYGRNALFRGMDLEEGATAIERNRQIGGHRA